MADDSFLGLPISRLSLPGAVQAITRMAQSDSWRYVVTPNAAHLARLAQDEDLARIYRGAALMLLDSRVMALASRLAGLAPPPVVTGADLVAQLFCSTIGSATRVCVVGGSAATISRLTKRFGLQDVRHHAPPMGFWRSAAEIDAAARFAVQARADFTFLVVGSPQQERLAARIAAMGGARGVGICAGASIEFLTGEQRRAPRVVQLLALEWSWRLLSQPRRFAHRYLIESPQALRLLLRHAPRPGILTR